MADLTSDQEVIVRCDQKGHEWTVSCKDLAEEMRVGEDVLAALEKSNGESTSFIRTYMGCCSTKITDLAEHLRTCVRSFSSHLHPASHFLFALLRATQLAYIDAGLFSDALDIATKVTLAMKHLYPSEHPVISVQLVTFEKLLENVHGEKMPFVFAITTLRNAIAAAKVGFGSGKLSLLKRAHTRLTGCTGSIVELNARALLENLELGFQQYQMHQRLLQSQ